MSAYDPVVTGKRQLTPGDDYVLKLIDFEGWDAVLDRLAPREGRGLVKSA